MVARSLKLVLLVVAALFALYWLPVIRWGDTELRRVDILSDLRPDESEDTATVDSLLPPPPKPLFVDSCKTGLTCIEDYADSTLRGMAPFYEALLQHDTLARPVRIAYVGDSFIEGDILTAHLRSLLQQRFGGCGVGLVDITSPIHGFRTTVRHSFGGWESHAYTDTLGFERKRQGFNGRYFIPFDNAYVELGQGSSGLAGLDSCQVSTLYFKSFAPLAFEARVNGAAVRQFSADSLPALQSRSVVGDIRRVRWTFNPHGRYGAAHCYAVAMDGEQGIVLDNLSMRGSGGLHLRTVPQNHLREFAALRPYDLIVLQFGLNVATQRGTNYEGYYKGMLQVVEYLKQAFPQAGILVVGVGDRAYRNDAGELRTMPGVKNLIRYQQRLAAESKVAFWNLYQAMGGEGSMPALVEAKPQMANYDYTHINFRGGSHLAAIMYETLVYGLEQYERRKLYETAE